MEAVILGAGLGTRLSPSTIYVNKHFFPVYNQPLIYFPISSAIHLGCRRLIIIINRWHRREYEILKKYLKRLNLEVILIEQSPLEKGIPSAIGLSEKFVRSEQVIVILGDNVFLGDHSKLASLLRSSKNPETVVFSKTVSDPNNFGVVKRNDELTVVDLVEKPTQFIGNEILTGLYCFSKEALPFVKSLTESDRGETEITEFLMKLLENKTLTVQKLNSEFHWSDAGTVDSLVEIASKISDKSARCVDLGGYIEFAAFSSGLIMEKRLRVLLEGMSDSLYKQSILSRLDMSDRHCESGEHEI